MTTATAPAPKAPTQSAKPGATGEPAAKEKKPKVVKIPHPSLNADKDGKTTTPIKDIPADYDPKKVHKSLTRKDFTNEAPLLKMQAAELRARADKLEKEATLVATMGSAETRAKAKKLIHVREMLAKLEKELKEQGHDPDAIRAGEPKAEVATV